MVPSTHSPFSPFPFKFFSPQQFSPFIYSLTDLYYLRKDYYKTKTWRVLITLTSRRKGAEIAAYNRKESQRSRITCKRKRRRKGTRSFIRMLESSPLHDIPQCDSSNKLNNNKTAIILVEFNRFTHALYEWLSSVISEVLISVLDRGSTQGLRNT